MSELSTAPTREQIYANLQHWIEALRTTPHRQVTGVLRSAGNRYCCLGIAAEEVLGAEWNFREDMRAYEPVGSDMCGMLDAPLASQLGLKYQTEPIIGPYEPTDEHYWSHLNDAKGLTFAQIADRIEQDLLPLYAPEAP